MAYGVTTSRAHIDAVLGGAPDVTEIDWSAISDWKGNVPPSFVGRYFLGTATEDEVNGPQGQKGFCLWAHGEGNEPAAPKRIVPLQRPDPIRQQTTGSRGEECGRQDAHAITTYLQRCIDVGDLTLPAGAGYILVFLEVANGTTLSPDYWSWWAHMVYGAVLDVPGQGLKSPLQPAIACEFTQAKAQSPFQPEAAVRAALSQPIPAGRHSLCQGFWCRTALANPVFDELYRVWYHRSFDGPGRSVAVGAPATVQSTLPLIAIDEHATGADDPTSFAFEAAPWNPVAPPPPDSATLPANLPTQLGIDTASIIRRATAQCMSTKEIVIKRLPANAPGVADRGTWLDGPATRRFVPTFAARYLIPHKNNWQPEEAMDLFAAGMSLCSIWQVGREFGSGTSHATDAFTQAAILGQPQYTPVYFAVDITVGEPSGFNSFGERSPPLAEVVDYFHDLNRGYRTYLADAGATPYYIGAYAAANVLTEVYRAGLATHFFQPWPFNWGPPTPKPPGWSSIAPGWRAWPHLNLWQVLNFDGLPNLLADNGAIRGCTTDLDFDVAWGDPGSWEPT